jgi:hypothetical protein
MANPTRRIDSAHLDAVLTQQFAFDETFLASWKSASRVDQKSGSARATAAVVEEAVTATR